MSLRRWWGAVRGGKRSPIYMQGYRSKKNVLRSTRALPGAKKHSQEQKKVLPGAPEWSTFLEHCFSHNNNKVAKASHANGCSSNTTADTAAAAVLSTLPPLPPPPLRQPLSIRRRQTLPLMCSIAAAAARCCVMEGAALLSAGERSDKAFIDDFM